MHIGSLAKQQTTPDEIYKNEHEQRPTSETACVTLRPCFALGAYVLEPINHCNVSTDESCGQKKDQNQQTIHDRARKWQK